MSFFTVSFSRFAPSQTSVDTLVGRFVGPFLEGLKQRNEHSWAFSWAPSWALSWALSWPTWGKPKHPNETTTATKLRLWGVPIQPPEVPKWQQP